MSHDHCLEKASTLLCTPLMRRFPSVLELSMGGKGRGSVK